MVGGLEVRGVPILGCPATSRDAWELTTYGTIDGGLELMTLALPTLTHRWGVRREGRPPLSCDPRPPERVFQGHHRLPHDLLVKEPVDLVILERGMCPPQDFTTTPGWEIPFDSPLPLSSRPQAVLESWPPGAALWPSGPMSKIATSRWNDRGYQSHCLLVNATRVGGALDQSRLLITRVLHASPFSRWRWEALEDPSEPSRPMSNLLTPPGLLKRGLYLSDREVPCPTASIDPMPASLRLLLQLERAVHPQIVSGNDQGRTG